MKLIDPNEAMRIAVFEVASRKPPPDPSKLSNKPKVRAQQLAQARRAGRPRPRGG